MNQKMLTGKWMLVGVLSLTAILGSCRKQFSNATGFQYNQPKNGGFELTPVREQETGPNLVLVEGGTFTMGRVEQEVNFDNNNAPRRVTVPSFYMDQTEVSNLHWTEYLFWLNRIYGADYPEVCRKALPDTLIWREKMEYNEMYVEYYLRANQYRDYPVVGVNWLQANDYAKWRTDRVNETILIREGILEMNPGDPNEPFTTESYRFGQYTLHKKKEEDKMINYDPNSTGRRLVQLKDGILLPDYRLPTEAEWEFAAYALIGNTEFEMIDNGKLYPWTGHFMRDPEEKTRGEMLANFVRGRGDYAGVAGHLNDAGMITTPVMSYLPNDYGLYNMAGNVSEWVLDVYRPLSPEDVSEFNPFRGNDYKTRVKNAEGNLADKYDIVIYDLDGIKLYLEEFLKIADGKLNKEEAPSGRLEKFSDRLAQNDADLTDAEDKLVRDLLTAVDKGIELVEAKKLEEGNELFQEALEEVKGSEELVASKIVSEVNKYVKNIPGEMRWRSVTMEENLDRLNYRYANYKDYRDGDIESSMYYDRPNADVPDQLPMYQSGTVINNNLTTMINNRARVIKGGSWRDRAYYMSPGTRRFLDERRSHSWLGFRCAMHRLGSPSGN